MGGPCACGLFCSRRPLVAARFAVCSPQPLLSPLRPLAPLTGGISHNLDWVFLLANATVGDRRKITNEQATDLLIEGLQAGLTVEQALSKATRSRSWYEANRRKDPFFKNRVDLVRELKKDRNPVDRVALAGSYSEFSERFLGTRVFPHSQNVVDIIEGRDPSWVHDSFIFEKGTSGHRRLLTNLPPNFAKSMTVTIGYATYRICRDPNVRIIVVSKTQALARKFLGAIQSRLTHPNYKDLQLAFGPQDGFKATADQWSADRMFLGGEVRDPQEKDPTVEALGFGSQIYGARADLIILDDVVTLSNAAEYEKQMDWIRQEVASRLGPGGVLLVIGTRVAPVDLYRELRNPDHYTDGRSPWTYLAMPAVLDTGTGDPETWTTLWPKSDRPFDEGDEADEDGLFDRWTGERLHTVRNEVGPNKWSMVYQQLDVSEDATFDPIAVRGCVNGFRKPGPLHPGAPGYPVDTDGFYTICSLDPAMSGGVAACAYAVDRVSKKRYVLDIRVLPGATTPQLQSLVHEFADKFRPQEFVIETNAMNLYVYQDPVITDYLRARGIVLKPHYTGNNKVDPNLGVASMGPLFGTVSQRGDGRGVKHDGNGLIELPDQNYPGIKSLIEQLVTWVPNKRGSKLKQDAVMAMWFCETRAREVIMSASSDQWFTAGGGFTSQRDMERRQVIALDEWSGHNPVVFL